MDYVYTYRKNIGGIYKNLSILLTIFFILGFINVSIAISYGNYSIEEIIYFYTNPVLFLVGAITMYWMYSRLNEVQIILDEDLILYKDKKQEIIFKYQDIIKIKTSSPKYFGSWIKIYSSDKKISLTVALNHIDSFVIELKKRLDVIGLSDKYNRSLYNFFKNATYSKQSFNRKLKHNRKIVLFSIAPIIITIIALFIKQPNLYEFGLFTFILLESLFLCLVGVIITEIIFILKLRKQFNPAIYEIINNDEIFEKKVYIVVTIIGFIIYLLSLSLLFI